MRTINTLLGLTTLCLLTVAASAKNYYVRTNGKDTNTGTANTTAGAWKTIERACTGAQPGDVINVADGTYTLTRTAQLKKGVTLTGASRANTKLLGGSAIPYTDGTKTMIQVVNTSSSLNTVVKRMTLNGASMDSQPVNVRYTRALGVNAINNIEVTDVKLLSFRAALEFGSSSYIDIHDFEGLNAGTAGLGVIYSGAVDGASITHFHVWNANLRCDSSVTPGQALGGGSWHGSNYYGPDGHVDDIDIGNVTFSAVGTYSDSANNQAGFNMEFFGGTVSRVHIHDCHLDGTISFPAQDNAGGWVEMDHNIWTNTRIYAIETYGTSWIHDNSFSGGNNAIAGFGYAENCWIEANTFVGQTGSGYAPILHFGGNDANGVALKDFTFTGNHVYVSADGDWMFLVYSPYTVQNVAITNNDFHASGAGVNGQQNFINLITGTPGLTSSGNTFQ